MFLMVLHARARAFTHWRAKIFAFTRGRAKERGGGKKERRCEPAARTKVGRAQRSDTYARDWETWRASAASPVMALEERRRGRMRGRKGERSEGGGEEGLRAARRAPCKSAAARAQRATEET